MRVLCVGYRSWALNIYERLKNSAEHELSIIRSKKEYNNLDLNTIKPKVILFYGWSWIIPLKVLKTYTCLMLHPSPLPKYRGGSPIQNQIIRGEKKSAVTLFIMNEKIDAGDIVGQKEFSLSGTISDIFNRMENIGFNLTQNYLKGNFKITKQAEENTTYYSRRNRSESEITIDEIKNKDGEYLYNKIRMLMDPYPNAFIKTKDGKKILIKKVEICKD